MNHHQISTPSRVCPRRHGPAAIALALVLVFPPRRAGAAELADADLVVERTPAADDCPDAPALAKQSLALGSAKATHGAPLHLAVRFDRHVDGYIASIEAKGRKNGTRELETTSDTCQSLASATAVVLAVITDLIPPREREPLTPTPTPVTATPAPVPAPAPVPDFVVALGIDSGVSYGLVGKAATATAGVSFRPSYRSAELELSAFASTPNFEPVAPGILEVGLWGGTLLGCYFLGAPGRATLGACAGLGIGSLAGRSHGYDLDGGAANLWLAADGGVAARLPIRRQWALRFSLTALVPLNSQAFLIAPGEQGFHSAPAAVSFRFGPELRFL